MGGTEPGIEILLLTLKGGQAEAVGEPVSAQVCVCFFMIGWGSLHSVCHAHGARGLAYAAVFMALQIHSVLPPRHLFDWLCAYGCAQTRASIMRGVCVCARGGGVPLCPAPGFVSPFPA